MPHYRSPITENIRNFLTAILLLLATSISAHAAEPQPLAASNSAWLGNHIDSLSHQFNLPWLNRDWLWGITAARWIASGAILVGACAISMILLRCIIKFVGRLNDKKPKSWPKVILAASRKPLILLVLTLGTDFGLGLLLGSHPHVKSIATCSLWIDRLSNIGLIIAVFWLLFRVVRGLQKKLQLRADATSNSFDNILVPVLGLALRLLILALGLFILQGSINLAPPYDWIASKFAAAFLIGSVAWLIIRTTTVIERSLITTNRIDVDDNLRARQIYTQVSVIRRIIIILVTALALACMLMLFESVRQFGTSILASAGIVGIVLGLAAQKTLTNLIAGIQIAISQPIRIDDVVVVEGEWGKIEEITLTYVTVCIWDLRRLVLPIQYFIENPFQNWTRQSAKVINSVFLHTDYTLPVEPIRNELRRLLEKDPNWDGDCCVLQVTDSKPQSMELRCLMSSKNASKGWDLKCKVREELINFIRDHYPESLPRLRAEITRDGSTPDN